MQEMLFPIELPLKAPIMQIEIWDEDQFKDEHCCSLDIDIAEVLKYQGGGDEKAMLKWINLYGGPNDFAGATQRWMNRNPDKGSEWKGRIMVEYFAEDAKYPKARKASLNKEKAEAKLKESMKLKKYGVIGQISSGIALPDEDTKDKKYQIRVSIGKRKWETGEAK